MLTVLAAAFLGQTASPPIRLVERAVLGLPVRAIEADTSNPKVEVGLILASGFPGGDEDFASMLRRDPPMAAVNGAYFSGTTKLPIGDVAVGGRILHEGRMGAVFSIDGEGALDIHRVIRHRRYAWADKRFALGCGPTLMLDGQVDVRWREEGFQNPSVTGRTQRMALGYTKERRLLLVHIRKAVTFEEEAKVMQALGCHEAMNLDAGASLAMQYRGKTLLPPGRKLTTVVGVWLRP